MSDVKWIKVYTEMFKDNRKIKDIEAMPKGDTFIVIWLKLLLLAGEINDGGAVYVVSGKAYTNEALAYELRRPVKVVKAALELFSEYNMIVVTEGIIYIKNWSKYQNEDKLAELREYNRLAQQKSRTKKKRLQDVNVNDNVNDKSGNVIDMSNDSQVTCHGCQGTEERIKNIEYSFIHSIARAQGNDEDFEGGVENSVDEATLLAEKREKQRKHLGGIGKGVVMLSDEQIESLLEELSLDEFNKYVGIVAECELSGQKFTKKTHFQAILDMAYEDRKIKQEN